MQATTNQNEGVSELQDANGETLVCENCCGGDVRSMRGTLAFQYGLGEDEVTLGARVPLLECGACGFRWTTVGTEDAQEQAINEYAERMRPSQIRALRHRADMSQIQFAKALGVGDASVKRWELGLKVPSRANNRILNDFAAGLDKQHERKTVVGFPRFRTNIVVRRAAAAQSFDLATPFPAARPRILMDA